MRVIEDHKVNECNEKLTIEVLDEPGAGGACHRYLISGIERLADNPSNAATQLRADEIEILFQNGPIPENGTNGITQEVLLAIVIDRLRCFQKGPYACPENEDALGHLIIARDHLHDRTRKRIERGVEGTHEV